MTIDRQREEERERERARRFGSCSKSLVAGGAVGRIGKVEGEQFGSVRLAVYCELYDADGQTTETDRRICEQPFLHKICLLFGATADRP